MLILFLSVVLAGTFAVLSVLHFYWGIKGSATGLSVVPVNAEGKLLFTPSRFDSFMVGIVLLVFFVFVLIKTQWIHFILPHWIMSYGLWFIAVLFLLRAIGDFKYMGFGKKINGTPFARMDTLLYTPLCLILALSAIVLNLLT